MQIKGLSFGLGDIVYSGLDWLGYLIESGMHGWFLHKRLAGQRKATVVDGRFINPFSEHYTNFC